MAAGEQIRRPRQWGLRSQWDFGAAVTTLMNKGYEAFLSGSEDDQENILELLFDLFEPVVDDDFRAEVKDAEDRQQRKTRSGRHAVFRAYHHLIARRKMYPQRTIGDRVDARR